MATNLARDRFRWQERHPQISLDATAAASSHTLEEKLSEAAVNPSEALLAEERGDWVRRAVAALPEDLRIPLILSEYESYSQAEIGDMLQCSAKAVEMRLYRARQALRKMLSPRLAG